MSVQERVIQIIQSQLASGPEGDLLLDESSALADLGFTSLHLITLMLALQDHFGLEGGELMEEGLPATFGELLHSIQKVVRR